MAQTPLSPFLDMYQGFMERRFRAAALTPRGIELPVGNMYTWVGGEGPPLLLLQGFGSDAVYQWHPQVGALAKGRRLIVPDLLFFGNSRAPGAARSLDSQLKAVLGVLDALGVHQVDVLGSSYGGFVAWKLAGEHPRRVRRLVMVDCPGPIMTHADHERILETFSVSAIQDLLLPDEPAKVRRLLSLAWHKPPWVPELALEEVFQRQFTDQVQEKRELLDELLSKLDDASLDRSAVPHRTLVLWGELDPLFPVEQARRLYALQGKRGELSVLRRTAHAPNMERARAFNGRVLRFLES